MSNVKLRSNSFRSITFLLIIAFVGAFFFTVAPIEEAEALPAHPSNCRSEVTYNSDGSWSVSLVCDWEFHGHLW